MNSITEVRIYAVGTAWTVEVTKAFAEQYGGGKQVFTEYVASAYIGDALDVARSMVTLTPSRRTA